MVRFGICNVSVAPLRSSVSEKSEMVSQLLFGETFEILAEEGHFMKIRHLWDNTIAWLDASQQNPVSEADALTISQQAALSLELVQPAVANDHFIPLLMGSQLPFFDGIQFMFCDMVYRFSGQAIASSAISPHPSWVVRIARKYLYAPYLLGGRTAFGIDDAALVQLAFKFVGIRLWRDASQQMEQGVLIDFIENAQAADLLFFENSKGKSPHVGIVIDENKILHVHGRVRIDRFDHFGIYDESKEKYTHRLRLIKRILPTSEPSTNTRTQLPQSVIVDNQAQLFDFF